MTDKVQKIREEVEMLQNELIQEKEKGYGSDVDDACILELQNVLTYIDSLQEEPVNEDLEAEINYLSKRYPEVSFAKLSRIAVHVVNWQKEQMIANAVETTFNVSLSCGVYDKLKAKFCEEGDKLLVVKKDEL